jgi:hypothetical protein
VLADTTLRTVAKNNPSTCNQEHQEDLRYSHLLTVLLPGPGKGCKMMLSIVSVRRALTSKTTTLKATHLQMSRFSSKNSLILSSSPVGSSGKSCTLRRFRLIIQHEEAECNVMMVLSFITKRMKRKTKGE